MKVYVTIGVTKVYTWSTFCYTRFNKCLYFVALCATKVYILLQWVQQRSIFWYTVHTNVNILLHWVHWRSICCYTVHKEGLYFVTLCAMVYFVTLDVMKVYVLLHWIQQRSIYCYTGCNKSIFWYNVCNEGQYIVTIGATNVYILLHWV